MKKNKGKIICSPSDLVTFLGCQHASFLDVKALSKKIPTTEDSSTAKLLQKKGLEHEAAFLQSLKKEGKTVAEIPDAPAPAFRTALTLEAMKSGADVIYQASLSDDIWQGYADFLIKSDTPSALGGFSYEALDAKLARTADPKHIMQLCVYSELLADLQSLRPAQMYLYLGDQTLDSYRVSDFFYYYKRVRNRFAHFIKNVPTDSYPEPCSHCTFCKWRDRCQEQWDKDDHLSLVANIQRSQMEKLRKAGVRTVEDLAKCEASKIIPDLNPDVFGRLRSQATLQHKRATTGNDHFEIIPFKSGKGFDRMPEPDRGDLFFDMEGDPLYPKGLEYLFGVYYFKNRSMKFEPFWAHDHSEEKAAFQRFMAFLAEHLSDNPHAHIYHYNHYETTALKRLACRYAVCEEQLDNLLRQQKFVDLYLVVRESLRTSEPGYSIKNLETFYMKKRANEVSSAADSIIVYNEWRETGVKKLLKQIADYNKVDCVSTQLLRDWLLTLKPENSPWFKEKGNQGDLVAQARKSWEIDYEKYQNLLGVNEDNPNPLHERLAHLLEFHNREAKPQWWSCFDRTNKSEEELLDDTECLAGMNLIGKPQPEKNSLIYTYQFPDQDYKLKAGSTIFNAAKMKSAGQITKIDEDRRIVEIKHSAKKEDLPNRLSIGPSGPVDSSKIRDAIYSYADDLLNKPTKGSAATELLNRNIPHIRGKKAGKDIISGSDLQAAALKAVEALDHSYLFIQGPPGAGKTYTSSHIIVELIRSGKKIGVTSNSHKAIHNLLDKVENVAAEKGVQFRGIKKSTSGNKETEFNGNCIRSKSKTEEMDTSADLFAGTVWTFANPHFRDQLDYLFVDEAGQVSTANIVAMSTATENIILVGDQMQLGQPIQGIHPGEAGQSVLEFLLGDLSTIPPERGIFLDQTRRMRPSVCQFISDAFYDGRLKAHESSASRSLDLSDAVGLPNEGIVFIPAEHEGCSQKSEEEGEIIRSKFEALLGQKFTDTDGAVRSIVKEDILVVTPYNVQVNHLRSVLPKNARVGTVDKFQGQEAPIVLISMVTSSGEDLPRNIEFLYSKNRLNVAISRAQCLAVVVANPNLLEVSCNSVEPMKLVNTFCWLHDYAQSVEGSDG